MQYISPIWNIDIGTWTVTNMTRFDVFSARLSPTDRAEIEFTRKGFPYSNITKGQKISMCQGYLGRGLWRIFSGKVTDVVPQGKAVTVLAQDLMQDLKVKISRAFVSPVPQDIIKFGLSVAGVTNYQLSSQVFQPKPGFIAANESFVGVIKRVNSTWSIPEWGFYFDPEEKFYWGPWEESDRYLQSKLPVLEYGQNILSHRLLESGTQGELETIALPFLRHSHRVKIIDPRYWNQPQVVRLEKVHYHHSAKARMKIEWAQIAKQ
ncbi:MAG: hypothetical protein NUV48_15205 [Peptococcaceae bacterium]|nr:hypothetical protein [Peptococcaceae bacterium]